TNKACYVVITCDEPSEGGNMQVEMTYEGDPTLAAFLLDSARDYVDSQIEEADLMDTPSFDLS
ncbi:MAG: hypothetical protein KDK78_07655, partial [Chlamydiia bacterium]|nr:hypothetical protein [Chlamydiia bacterium]